MEASRDEFIDASFQDLGIDIHTLVTDVEEVDGRMKQDAKAKLVFLSEFAKINKEPCIQIEIEWTLDGDPETWEAGPFLWDDYLEFWDDDDDDDDYDLRAYLDSDSDSDYE